MLFNSIDFALFLPTVFALYWSIKNVRIQNGLIVLASYFFYGWWDWRFLSLILFSSLVDYSIGIQLKEEASEWKRKLYLWLSIGVNLGFLGFFKYYNFFLDNFVTAFSFFGKTLAVDRLDIILPVGISFYTFQTLSYSIDVYKRKLEPTKDFIAFTAFVSFFPQLVAGPIERATKLLPQFYQPRQFEYDKAVDGLRQILWGFFKKVVIADSCAVTANLIFNNSGDYSGSTLALGAILFTFQIYGDFSGYSDIAIGTARLFGFDLMKNFAFPYFSRDIAEFWRRWHISLSTWFRDYLYIPLGGSRGGTAMKVRNTFIIFLVSGFWHGANWTYIVWGLLNAIYFLPLLLTNNNRNNLEMVAQGRWLPSAKEVLGMLTTFALTVLAWIFFRASSIEHAFSYIAGLCSVSLLTIPEVKPITTIVMVLIFLVIEWGGREGAYALEKLGLKWQRPLRLLFYYVLGLTVLLFSGQRQEFIYFQF
ncbi:MBOAT family protein [Aureispira sp. CCB-QB1]|uniref:MBOAT family O-acyltransferase n=1 Tax=Aureispira sp. CCB-QB1 TaxID=1313421 RepID=UPI00069924A0|nr:MBOAT family O-acyltransferase [Aureispira sp. CCB-QB1]